jgi:hypothetical protein
MATSLDISLLAVARFLVSRERPFRFVDEKPCLELDSLAPPVCDIVLDSDYKYRYARKANDYRASKTKTLHDAIIHGDENEVERLIHVLSGKNTHTN